MSAPLSRWDASVSATISGGRGWSTPSSTMASASGAVSAIPALIEVDRPSR